MQGIKAAITGVHAWVPEDRLTNADLEKMVDTNDEWIQSRTGVKERRLLKGEGQGTSVIGVNAVNGLLKKMNISPDEVEMVICGTVTGDAVFPDTANIVAHKCGIKKAYCFDVNAACSGFLYALSIGSKFVESGMYKKVIVIGADKMSSIINYEDRATCIIFGDGGGAVMLEPNTEGNGMQDERMYGDGSGIQYLNMPAGGSVKPATHETVDAKEHYVFQEGRPVFKAAVRGMSSVVKEVMERNELTAETVDWLIPHQANIRIIESVAKMADFPLEKVVVNIHKYGNTTAGTIPLCLWEWENKFKKGDNIILTAFGGGFTWGASYLKWAY